MRRQQEMDKDDGGTERQDRRRDWRAMEEDG